MEDHKTTESASPETTTPAAPAADDMTRALPVTDGLAVSAILPKAEPQPVSGELPPLTHQEPPPAAPAEPVAAEPVPTKAEPPKRKRRRWYHWLGKIFLFLLKWAVAAVLIVAILAGGLVGYLSITEYKPAYAEKATTGVTSADAACPMGQTLRIVTFNTGYGGLGEEADFFMDGGTSVHPVSDEQVVKNMQGIEDSLVAANADILLLQEVDTDSDRSFHRNQWQQYEFDLEDYETRFALNYSCDYVPYPLNERIGEVHSGIATYSRFDITSATRYSLPVPFQWPVRIANLKRCLLVTRIPVEGSTQELVIVNLHLEAYDDGEGKAAQTQQLLALLEAEYAKGNYVIAGGDFNQTFPGAENIYPVKDTSGWAPGLLEELPAYWEYAYDDSAPTCRLLNQPYDPTSSLTQYYIIDGFIVSPNVQIVSTRTMNRDFAFSDHNPVLLEVILG